MKKITLLTLATFLFISLTTGCTKEGPEGPAGKDGNANVKSIEFTIYSHEWVYESQGNFYLTAKLLPEIDQDVADNGAVLLYYKADDNMYIALPAGNLFFGYDVGNIAIFSSTEQESTNIFKAVIIHGSPDASAVDVTNYNEVSNYYGLDQ